MARPNWEYVRVDVLLPDNPKLDGLSAAAKWTLVELWCYCGQHLTDGFVRDAKWKQFGTPAIRAKLISHGLAEPTHGGYLMHDYLDHQRSRKEVTDLKEKRAAAGRKGGNAKANAKQVPEQKLEHVLKQTASKPVAEAEAEAEAEVVRAEVGDQSSRRNAWTDDDLNTSMMTIIQDEIHHATGRDIDTTQAQLIASSILSGRSPDDPIAYVRQAIRSEPDARARWLGASSSHPSARTPTEAAFAAGIVPNGHRADDETVADIAARIRHAITRSDP